MSKKSRKRNRSGFTPIPRKEVPLPEVDRKPCDYSKHSLLTFMKNVAGLGQFYHAGDSFHTLKLRLIQEGKAAPFYEESTFDFIVMMIVANRKTLGGWLANSKQLNPPDPVPERKQETE